MSRRCKLQKEYYQANGQYKGSGQYNDKYVAWLEEQVFFLRKNEENKTNTTHNHVLKEMENDVISYLSELEEGYASRKHSISKATGIPIDILTVILKRLKTLQAIEIVTVWREDNGIINGSGYCLKKPQGA